MQQPQTAKMIVSDADVTSRCRCVNVPGSYMIFPRANRVEHHLPGFDGVLAQVLSTPQHGAKFVEHELLIKPNGKTLKPRREEFEQFFYLLEGEVKFDAGRQNPQNGCGQLRLAAPAGDLCIPEPVRLPQPDDLDSPPLRSGGRDSNPRADYRT